LGVTIIEKGADQHSTDFAPFSILVGLSAVLRYLLLSLTHIPKTQKQLGHETIRNKKCLDIIEAFFVLLIFKI
jgi:hypothetical protein